MRSILYLLGALASFSTVEAAHERDSDCTSNVYLVDKREHKSDTWTRFEKTPDSVPAVMAQIFKEIGTVPIDASDAYISSFFTAAPEIQATDEKKKTFVWHQSAGKNEVHLNLTKENGCIKQFVLSYRNPASKSRKTIESLIQNNLIPEPGLAAFAKDDERICQLQQIKHQRITYSVNGKPRYITEEKLPAFAAFTLRSFLHTSLHGAQRTLYELGAPERVRRNLVWNVKDGHGKPYFIEVAQEQSCDKTMSINWKNHYGVKYRLERENTFVNPEP
ncbi:hypothetical protein IOQ59_02335 [Pontibacterium sp. N1Y112]|uniref:Uncharacterized protein n=1 Tax=Pontibacterium sinense TaxID=2781979 RepID=A0A8J7JX97_9GAMM|nr:hypothetical protein [Pontibacterium sinense]MBE9396093.1 hypothetical protein [Pontibacterium sinense]